MPGVSTQDISLRRDAVRRAVLLVMAAVIAWPSLIRLDGERSPKLDDAATEIALEQAIAAGALFTPENPRPDPTVLLLSTCARKRGDARCTGPLGPRCAQCRLVAWTRERCDARSQDTGSTGRRPDGRHQSVAGGRGAGGAALRPGGTRLRRAPRRARHRQRRLRRSDAGDPPQPRAGGATPGSTLGSTRDKPDLKYCQQIFEVLRAHGIGHFFYIGGNDSSDTVRIVSEEAAKSGYPLRCVHIPKTIDNDLVCNDHTPGFPSAARFVAQAFAGANLDNAALPGVYVAVVMGRHAGFLTAAAAGARKFAGRWPALDLPARAHVHDRALPGRREGRARTPRPLRGARCPRASTMRRASRSSRSWPSRSSAMRTATCSCQAAARWPTCCASRSRLSSD